MTSKSEKGVASKVMIGRCIYDHHKYNFIYCRAQVQVQVRSESSEIDLSHTLLTHPPPPTGNFFLCF